MFAAIGTDGEGFRREEIVGEGGMQVRTGAKVFVCDDEVGEEYLFAITDEAG